MQADRLTGAKVAPSPVGVLGRIGVPGVADQIRVTLEHGLIDAVAAGPCAYEVVLAVSVDRRLDGHGAGVVGRYFAPRIVPWRVEHSLKPFALQALRQVQPKPSLPASLDLPCLLSNSISTGRPDRHRRSYRILADPDAWPRRGSRPCASGWLRRDSWRSARAP